MLPEKVKAAILQYQLCQPGEHLLLAVSGGADSVALLRLFICLAADLDLQLSVAHVNHGLRGTEADADAAFVSSLAEKFACQCFVTKINIRRQAKFKKISLEMAGRAARYEFLVETAQKLGCHAIVTAHTADDHVETALLNLIRGSGTQGLAGIPRVNLSQAVKVIRPLRDIWRKELIEFLKAENQIWREDKSNRDTRFLRNRIRQEVLPLLARALNPKIKQALWQTTDILEQEHAWLGALVEPVYQQCRIAGDLSVLNGDLLKAWPLAARRRILRLWLSDAGIAPETLSFDSMRRLEELLFGHSGQSVSLPGGFVVCREYGFLKLLPRASPVLRRASGQNQVQDIFAKTALKIPGWTRVPGQAWKIQCAIQTKLVALKSSPYSACLSVEKWSNRQIYVRPWQPGDRMLPYGMTGTRKLQDIFSDLRIPLSVRRSLPIAECEGEIIWFPGYRIAAAWAVLPSESNMLNIRYNCDDEN